MKSELYQRMESLRRASTCAHKQQPIQPGSASVTVAEIGLVKRLADAIKLSEHFAQDPGGKLYRFSGGVYTPDGVALVKRRVKTLLDSWNQTAKWSSFRSQEVVEYISLDAPNLWEQPPLDLVNVQNGLLNVQAGQLQDHSPEHLSSVRLPVVYDPEARCIEWASFVEEVFPTDTRALAWQIPAWLMRPDISQQKGILLLGEGNNGKSTYLRALRAFLGRDNVSALTLHQLESDRFAAARLFGKLANICADLPSSHLIESCMFKALTGGDAITAQYKFRDSFEFVPFARLLFSANHLPQSLDASHAFFRRWLVVPFNRTFELGEEIPRNIMDQRLARPTELSGVLNKAILALKEMQECGGLTESPSMGAARDEFRKLTDPFAVWLDIYTIENSDAVVKKEALISAYNGAAAKEGRPRMTAKAMGQALKRLRPNVKEAQRTVGGETKWVWLGLGLRETKD